MKPAGANKLGAIPTSIVCAIGPPTQRNALMGMMRNRQIVPIMQNRHLIVFIGGTLDSALTASPACT
jgi:hypothetical protein